MRKWLACVAFLAPFAAQAEWVPATDTPPPGHTCEDLYRTRDLPETFGGPLYVDTEAVEVAQPIACTPRGPWPPVARPRNRD